MRTLAVMTAFAAVLAAGAAFADTMQNGVGNTFVVTDSDGTVVHYHFDADGSFTASTPEGEQVAAGAYEVTDSQLCLTPAGGERGCTEYVGDKNVGDSWTQQGTDGAEIRVTLQAGR